MFYLFYFSCDQHEVGGSKDEGTFELLIFYYCRGLLGSKFRFHQDNLSLALLQIIQIYSMLPFEMRQTKQVRKMKKAAKRASNVSRKNTHQFARKLQDMFLPLWAHFVLWTICEIMLVLVKELSVLDNVNYKIMFMLDSLAMITVHHPKYGVIEVSHWDVHITGAASSPGALMSRRTIELEINSLRVHCVVHAKVFRARN